MVRRTAQFYTYGSDTQCLELMKYLEEAGIRLDVRDIEKAPLSSYELRKLIGYCNVNHFLNPMSPSYEKNGLGDKSQHDRDEIIELILKDHTLLRRPLVRTSRLTTIGCDKKVIDSVLQIGVEAPKALEEGNRGPVSNQYQNHYQNQGQQNRSKGSKSRSKGSSRSSKGGRPRGAKGSNNGRSSQVSAGR